jgi:UDP-GlcNAc:undecaprenyl-phosphate GlcNAc-1-phosphate transferase
MMFTTKFLDGLDGLVSGIVTIAAGVIFIVSIQPQWFDPNVALLSIVFAGTCLGFLVWNFNPAKIFLGEGGSLVTGFILGCLAIISKSKIAITLMVVGIPMIDVVRVMIMRLRKGKPVYIGDREHLHYRLLESGTQSSPGSTLALRNLVFVWDECIISSGESSSSSHLHSFLF